MPRDTPIFKFNQEFLNNNVNFFVHEANTPINTLREHVNIEQLEQFKVARDTTWEQLWTTINPVTPKKDDRRADMKEIIGKMYRYEPLSKYQGLEGNTPMIAGTTFVGLEIELEKVKVKKSGIPDSTWNVHDDGSLKESGKEFVTIPIQTKYLEVELDRLFGSLESFNPSSRCSVHVHLNARDFSLGELKTFLALYTIFEKSLYKFSGDRINNNFCVPLYYNRELLKKFVEYLDAGLIREEWYKYFGLNLSPIFGGESRKLGTIEFRHMIGNFKIQYILVWINLIVGLKRTAKSMELNELLEEIKHMNETSSYYKLADEVFKEYAPHISGQTTFKTDVESCVALAKTIFSAKSVDGSKKINIPILKKG